MTTITFIGAGSVEFTRDLIADLLSFDELAGIELRLHDIDDDRLATAVGTAESVARQLGVKPSIVACPERVKSLDGADFVINMIAVGGHQATRTDFEIPAALGLRQTIGDTVGIGGIFRGLRTFPVLAGIAHDMLAVCPEAWLLNYTNPMAMNVAYLAAIAPDLKVVGLCHSVYWTVRGLCEVVEVPFDEVSYWSAGVNHQAWLLRWERNGTSLYPLLDERIAADPELRRRVRVDMYRRFGYYPTETSEHSSEYVPWYLRHDTEIERLRIPVSAYVQMSADNVATYEATRACLADGREIAIESETTEYAPQVIHSLVTGTKRTIFGNVRNTGLISNLPQDYAVEVPCSLDEFGVHPIHVGALPPALAALNRTFIGPGEVAVQAAVTGDARLVRNAAMLDPNTAATLTVNQIWALCDRLTLAHGELIAPELRVPVRL